MGDISSLYNFSPSSTDGGDHGPAPSDTICFLKSPIKLFGSSRRKDEHHQAGRSIKQKPSGKHKSWLLCSPSSMAVQETLDDDNHDCRSLSFRTFFDQKYEGEEEDRSINAKVKYGDDDKSHSFKFYILEDHGEEELDVFDVSKTPNKTSTTESVNPNSSLQTRKKMAATSKPESMKVAQRALSSARFGRMREKMIEMVSLEKLKRRILGLAMQMNAKPKKSLPVKNYTKKMLALENDHEEFWKKKVLMGRRCKPMKMEEEEDDDDAFEGSSCRSAKVAPWMTSS